MRLVRTRADLDKTTRAEAAALRVLDDAAARVRVLWEASLDSSDFDLVTRLAEAGQAIERAKLALRRDSARWS